MRVAGIIENDIVDGPDGVCVSVWLCGCPHKCKGCHNQIYWDFNSGEEIDEEEVAEMLKKAINKNGIIRDFSVLGGEPLCKENIAAAEYLISKVREAYPDILITVWTGYTLEELKELNFSELESILGKIDFLIDGRYVEELRDTSLKLRGSSNQRILKKGENF